MIAIKKYLILLLFVNTISYAKTNLLFYCGITMVNPMMKIAKIIEKEYNCKITIIQGGSQDMFNSLNLAKRGDLFLPGNDKYINYNDIYGYFEYKKIIGYNQLAIFVQKGNPKNIKSLDDFLRKDVLTTMGDLDTCSIGLATEAVLQRYKGKEFLKKVKYNLAYSSADSRDMSRMFRTQFVDAGISWKATKYFTSNIPYIDIVDIDKKYAPKRKLVITLLKFSEHKKIAKSFIDYVASPKGREIMREFGFIDE